MKIKESSLKLLLPIVALLLSCAMANAQSPTVTDGLVAYYPFNGNANDESGNDNNGTPMSNVTLTTGVNGDSNGAYLFGGYDNPGHISIENSETLMLSNAATISAYVKPISWVSMDIWGRRVESGGVMCFFAKSHDRSGMVFFVTGKDDEFNNYASCSNNPLDIGYNLQGNYLNKWTHLAYVFDHSKVRFYVNGTQVAENDYTPDFSVMNNQNLYIGKFSDEWYPFNGAIDEVRLYNRALSASEIQQLAKYSDQDGTDTPPDVANDHEYVDLGLPSGTLWATTNVGADKPEDYGYHFAWGETEPKSNYNLDSYFDSDYNKYNISGGLIELLPEDDVATANWGSGWQMPSIDQLQELINSNYTTSEWVLENGISGRKITSIVNGNSIFLPAAGQRHNTDFDYAIDYFGVYWSRTLSMRQSSGANYMDFSSAYVGWNDYGRDQGRSVRPVRVKEDDDNDGSNLILGTNLIMMTKGDAVELTYKSETVDASKITWSSDNNSVATVSSSGVISAVGDGTCKITASYDGNVQDKCTVFVGKSNESSDGHEYVDLGLPSGTQWAATNVGAESPEEYGYYFQWGDTVAKVDNVYNWTTYKFSNSSASALTKYCTDATKWAGENNPDKLNELEASDDVAYSQWGMAWRVPSLAQFKELVNSNYTILEQSMYNGVEGFLITSRTNGKCIFLPAASVYDTEGFANNITQGHYWSRTLSDNDELAYELFLENSTASYNSMTSRSEGLPIRPVYQGMRDNANLSVSATQLDFGNVATGNSRSVKFNIVNNTYECVEILPLTLQNKDFSIDWSGGEVLPNSSQEVTVTYTPTSTSSSVGEFLNVRTSSDSIVINVVASSHTGNSELTTKENLVVWLKDGSKTTFVLNEKPIVTIGDKTLKIDGATTNAEYNFKDILRLTYDGMIPGDVTKVFSVTETETNKPFTQTSEALVFSSDKEDLNVMIVSIAGIVVKRFTVQNGSSVTLPLNQIPSGVYVINVNNLSYKISIR